MLASEISLKQFTLTLKAIWADMESWTPIRYSEYSHTEIEVQFAGRFGIFGLIRYSYKPLHKILNSS